MTASAVTDESIAATRRVEEKARELWGDGFMLQVLFANDGDARVVATHSRPEDEVPPFSEKAYEELWHISSKHAPDEAMLQRTRQAKPGAWDERQQTVAGRKQVSLTAREE